MEMQTVTETATQETKMSKPAKKAAPKKAPAKSGKKITLVAKECPVRKGTSRAKFWAKLKTGLTTGEVDVPLRFIKKMAKAGHIKLG
jgi:hypothetical protein